MTKLTSAVVRKNSFLTETTFLLCFDINNKREFIKVESKNLVTTTVGSLRGETVVLNSVYCFQIDPTVGQWSVV